MIISNKLEQLKFKLEKNIGFRNMQETCYKKILSNQYAMLVEREYK